MQKPIVNHQKQTYNVWAAKQKLIMIKCKKYTDTWAVMCYLDSHVIESSEAHTYMSSHVQFSD